MFTDPIFKLNGSFLVWRSQAGFLFQDCIFLDYRSSQVYTGHRPNIIHWPYSYYLIPVYITRLIKYEIHLWKIWSKSINNVDSIPLAMHYTMQHKINLCSPRFSAFYSISFESVIDVMIQYNVDKCITKWYIYIYILKRYILLFDDVPYSLYRTCTYEW